MSGTHVSSLIHRLGGVYRDPQRLIRETKSLIRSPLGHHNDSTTTPPVLLLMGTLLMTYSGVKYNLPIDLYLPPPYSLRPLMPNCSPFYSCCFLIPLHPTNSSDHSTTYPTQHYNPSNCSYSPPPTSLNIPHRLSHSLASFDPEIPPLSLDLMPFVV